MGPHATLHDPRLPAVAALLGPGSGDLLTMAMTEAGGRVLGQRIAQIRYVPTRSITVQYQLEVLWKSGETTLEMIVATSGPEVPDGVPVFESAGIEIALWRFPNDPHLPGLAAVLDPRGAATVLSQLGAPTEVAEVRTRVYRAGRRAVLEVAGAGAHVFIKVVRPDRTAALHDMHSRLAGHLPVPHSLGWSAESGILALEAMPGRTLREAVESRSSDLPDPDSVLDLLARFPPVGPQAQTVRGPRELAGERGRLISAVVPDLAERVSAIVDRLHLDDTPSRDHVHGDFHPSQILGRDGGIVGLVDVDNSGAGDRIDDLATLLGSLTTLSLVSTARRAVDRYGTDLISAFDATVDPVELRLSTAAVVLGLATGPFRVQDPNWEVDTERRVALAERWIDSADRV